MFGQTTPNADLGEATIGGIWRDHHRYLLDVAYRMLGSVTEAEDIVQETFARLLWVDLAEIKDVRGWLVVVATRLCLDHLRSAQSRRELYVGPWLPEPVIQAPDKVNDPAERVTLDDSVRMAMLLVLERLSPAERAAFVLHDVFQFSFEEVAHIVERTPAACRQLASRARRRVRAETSPSRFNVRQEDLTHVADRFITAASTGDLQSLIQVLDPNVVVQIDSGGVVGASHSPSVGRLKVAKRLLGFLKASQIRLVPIPVNGEPGVLGYQGDRLAGIVALSFRDGLIDRIHSIANPYKLAYAASLLDAPILSTDEDPSQAMPTMVNTARNGQRRGPAVES